MGKHDTPTEQRRYRSGEAARLAQMPAATLRIWERRYAVVSPPKTATGQRIYSDSDVQRLRLIKALVDQGHAISAIAGLDRQALRMLVLAPSGQPSARRRSVALLIIGPVELPDAAELFEASHATAYVRSLEEADKHVRAGMTADALLVSVPSLHEESAADIAALARNLHANAVGVICELASIRATELARLAGMRVVRRADGHAQLAKLLADLVDPAASRRPAHKTDVGGWQRATPRFDDRMLSSLAGISSAIQCECPRHLADLVRQLNAFERYSDDCFSRLPADMLLHRHLGNVANRAMQILEAALLEVVRSEGLMSLVSPRASQVLR